MKNAHSNNDDDDHDDDHNDRDYYYYYYCDIKMIIKLKRLRIIPRIFSESF